VGKFCNPIKEKQSKFISTKSKYSSSMKLFSTYVILRWRDPSLLLFYDNVTVFRTENREVQQQVHSEINNGRYHNATYDLNLSLTNSVMKCVYIHQNIRGVC
jgi:hypothetical protein